MTVISSLSLLEDFADQEEMKVPLEWLFYPYLAEVQL